MKIKCIHNKICQGYRENSHTCHNFEAEEYCGLYDEHSENTKISTKDIILNIIGI